MGAILGIRDRRIQKLVALRDQLEKNTVNEGPSHDGTFSGSGLWIALKRKH